MASVPIAQPNWFIRSQFKTYLKILLNRFHDMMLYYTQDIQVVNFSQIDKGLVHVIITYVTAEGWPVNLEAKGVIGTDYMVNPRIYLASHEKGSIRSPGRLFRTFYHVVPPSA